MRHLLLTAFFCFLFVPFGKSIEPPSLQSRIKQNINKNWNYLENRAQNIPQNNLSEWLKIDLPHTWNQWDAVDMLPGYRRDASWYQKKIFIKDHGNAHYFLYFEGANISTQVYVNNHLAGSHIGGYVGFKIDISKWIKTNAENTIHVRVDNSYNPNIIPSQKADFFIYGGIVRDVWLEVLPKDYIKDITITTPNLSKTQAQTNIQVSLNNPNKNHSIKCQIIDPISKKIVAKRKVKFKKIKNGSFTLPTISNPKLWSPEHPSLYSIKITLFDGRKVLDETTQTIGYRWYHFEPNGAFFLNGQRLLIRGTHRHEEHAGFGQAMSNKLHRKDIEDIKEMGANFLRLAHYPQDPEIYKACDELGIIVWDELPWCRGGMGEKEWQSNTTRLLQEQINQNKNHPSIFFWSLGNEIYWLPDFDNGADTTKLNKFVSELNDLAHQLDPSRLTAIRKYYAGANLVDVFSPSIWSGWYAGVYTNYEKAIKNSQQKYPKFLHMEYGGSSHLGRHTENPIDGKGLVNADDWTEASNQINIKNVARSGDWSESYIVDLFDWHLGISETTTTFAGNAQWAFKDFGTPLRPENAIPYLNQKGLVDRAGKPKDAYYVFKSYWAKAPFTYIESHTWTERSGPKNKVREVCVFSNCDQVTLFHNGIELKTKDRKIGDFPANGFRWNINFYEEYNVLICNGLKDNKIIASDSLIVHYTYEKAGKADHIALNYSVLPNGNFLIEATMQDKNNQRVLDYEKLVYFAKDGAGELMKNYGTPTRSQIIQMANGRAAIELIPSKTGKATIEVRNQDFKGSYLVIDFSNQ